MNSYTEIVKKCQRNEQRAQLQFYNLFYKSVYNSCYRILNNPGEAEEVMQETFLKVFRTPAYFKDNADTMKATLKRIAINNAIDIYRKRKIIFTELTDTYNEIQEENEEEITGNIETIQQCLQLLPEGYKLILSLHLIENMKYEEIADQLQIKASTVRSQFARAKNKLVTLIKENKNHENIQ